MRQTPVVLFGLGPIGRQIGRLAAERDDLLVVGGVDLHPELVGKPLSAVLESPRAQGSVVSSVGELKVPQGTVALHATGSSLEGVAAQLRALAEAGFDVVSTCEELSFPWFHQKALAEALDRFAREHDVTFLGTGVNPGFAMDTLPLMLTAASRRIDSIRVEREVAAATRREPLQRKIGAGLTPEAFESGVRAGTIRHVGLPESCAALAMGLGFSLAQVEEKIKPVIARTAIQTQFLSVAPGQISGVHQVARGIDAAGKERVVLELTMSVDVPASVDKVFLTGEPPMKMVLEGIHGDTATAGIALNSIAQVVRARAGLLTMAELSLVHR